VRDGLYFANVQVFFRNLWDVVRKIECLDESCTNKKRGFVERNYLSDLCSLAALELSWF
jgi:hypothetical protein